MIKSEQINELATALAKAQAEFPEAKLDGVNPYFKKADGKPSRHPTLSSYLEAAKPILTKYGLAITQMPDSDGLGNQALTTVLTHSSGQYVGATFNLLIGKQDMQGLGSAITYARRYGLASILGMGVEDDDADQAVQRTEPKRELKNFAPTPKVSGAGVGQIVHGSTGSKSINGKAASGVVAGKKNELEPQESPPWPTDQDLR